MSSLRARFYSGLTLLAVVTTLTSIYHLVEIRLIRSQLTEVQRNAVPSIVLADRMELEAIQVQQWLTDVSATGDRSGLKEARAGYQNFKITQEEYRKIPGNNNAAEQDALLADFERDRKSVV